MGVVQHRAAFHMLYTALATAERGSVQRIGHATSHDLVRWHASDRWIEAAAPYETAPEHAPWVSWRDPKPVVVGDEVLVAICARVDEGPARRRGCVALVSTTDFERFGVEPPILRSGHAFEIECPQLYPIGERWVLLGSVIDDRSVRYWVANGPRGPFTAPAGNRLLPAGHYAARMFRWRGQDAILGWYRDGERPRVLPSPLRVELGDDGVLRCRRFAAWEARLGPEAPLRGLDVVRSPHGSALVTTEAQVHGFRLDASLQADAARVALAFGLDDDGGGMFVDLDPGELRISLRSSGRAGDRWFEDRVVQSAPLREYPRRVGLRVVDGEVEVTVDDCVVLLAVVEPRAGRLGLLVDSGEARLHNARLRTALTAAMR
jgi:hypothetical protein